MSDVKELTRAVFGGSFDPIHVGHVLCVHYLLAVGWADRVTVVVVFEHALNKDLSPFEHRLEMCRRVFAAEPRVEVSALERDLSRPSFTLNTLRALGAQHPADRLRLVVGSDVLAETDRWHRFDEVRALAPPIVVARRGHPIPDGDEPLLPEVSSTEIRRCFRQAHGDSPAARQAQQRLEQLVPRVALEYARTQGLYLGPSEQD